MYKSLVVGAAFLSSPQVTYITYLVVRAGWDNSQIATYVFTLVIVFRSSKGNYYRRTMLYHLITLNPRKDITLHVSTNNPAMVSKRSVNVLFTRPSPSLQLLYNRFGFKAEEFIVGFYEDYLHPQSRGSKNAFRLRLRQ